MALIEAVEHVIVEVVETKGKVHTQLQYNSLLKILKNNMGK